MMEIKEAEKLVIAKPVACRPVFSNSKPVLSGAINASPPADFSENAVAVIRPRTMRFKPTCNNDLVAAEALGSAASHPPKEVSESKAKSNVVYKPIAKLVSKTTLSLLANLGGHGISPTREITNAGAPIQPSNRVNHQNDPKPDIHPDFPVQSEKKKNATLENSEDDDKSLSNNADLRPLNDGHNWRKYGQKQVKGSEYPRSYFKCTHPNCPVKKKVEKTLDGQIAEIVYKGEHNHPKPLPPNHPAHDTTRNEVNNPNNIESFVAAPPTNDLLTAGTCNASVSTSNSSLGPSGECEEVSESLEAEGDDLKSKRSKCENQLLKESTVGGASSDPRVVVQKNTDSEVIGDGFRWRKYGQKVVKGKIYPRSYYRCTSPKCNVRKYVERMSEDPRTFITTYEGKHNHTMPVNATNAETSKTRSKNKSLTIGNG